MAKAKRNVHVVPSDKGWDVKKAGSKTVVSHHRTQKAAAESGRKAAKAEQSELVIHRPNGQIRDKDSFGPDPCPPKDTKH
ncbi:MAG: DUF2188 domain-containing protein [Phycisphaerae bacterium]|nr:DUF2188 domain-containing protein [Phycisphaerae bacterium]